MSRENWPTEPLIVIAKGHIKGIHGNREVENGSLAIRDEGDGWYWSTDGGWLNPEYAEISEYVPVIPVSLDGSLSMTWFTQYAPAEFAPTTKASEEGGMAEKYRKATAFMSTWEGPAVGDDISAIEVIAEMDLDDDTDMLKLAAGAYCASDLLCREIAEKAQEKADIDRAEILRIVFKVDKASNEIDQMEACGELAVAALARWGAMQ